MSCTFRISAPSSRASSAVERGNQEKHSLILGYSCQCGAFGVTAGRWEIGRSYYSLEAATDRHMWDPQQLQSVEGSWDSGHWSLETICLSAKAWMVKSLLESLRFTEASRRHLENYITDSGLLKLCLSSLSNFYKPEVPWIKASILEIHR